MQVSLDGIVAARGRIAGGVVETPCVLSAPLSEPCDAGVCPKLGYQQRTGGFKERGGRTTPSCRRRRRCGRGAPSRASAGNRALGMARHGASPGIPVTVAMPRFAPLIEVANRRKPGANIPSRPRFDPRAEEALQADDRHVVTI